MKTHCLMNTHTAGCLIVFGMFAILLGVIGYQTHREDAVTALIFRGGFGALLILCGVLGARSVRLSRRVALGTVTLLSLGCLWRTGTGWLTVAQGQAGRVFASLISTLMLALAGTTIWLLVKDRKAQSREKRAEHAP
jgi:hypothetical protein